MTPSDVAAFLGGEPIAAIASRLGVTREEVEAGLRAGLVRR